MTDPLVRGDAASLTESPTVSPPASCCTPDLCDEGERLRTLVHRGERLVGEYGDRIPLNVALSEFADHLRVDRASALLTVHRANTVDARSQS